MIKSNILFEILIKDTDRRGVSSIEIRKWLKVLTDKYVVRIVLHPARTEFNLYSLHCHKINSYMGLGGVKGMGSYMISVVYN